MVDFVHNEFVFVPKIIGPKTNPTAAAQQVRYLDYQKGRIAVQYLDSVLVFPWYAVFKSKEEAVNRAKMVLEDKSKGWEYDDPFDGRQS